MEQGCDAWKSGSYIATMRECYLKNVLNGKIEGTWDFDGIVNLWTSQPWNYLLDAEIKIILLKLFSLFVCYDKKAF